MVFENCEQNRTTSALISEAVKAVTWHFAAFGIVLLETFVQNLVPLTCPSLQILSKTQIGVFSITIFLVNLLEKNIVMTPEPVMILPLQRQKIKNSVKKSDIDVILENCDVIVIFLIYG